VAAVASRVAADELFGDHVPLAQPVASSSVAAVVPTIAASEAQRVASTRKAVPIVAASASRTAVPTVASEAPRVTNASIVPAADASRGGPAPSDDVASRVAADELFSDHVPLAQPAPAGDPFDVFAPAPAGEAADKGFEIPIELDAGPAEPNSVEVDFEALLAGTPVAPPEPAPSLPPIDASSLEHVDPLPMTPLGEPELPSVKQRHATTAAPPKKKTGPLDVPPRATPAPPPPLAKPPTPPVPQLEVKPQPAPAAPQATPVFLHDVQAGASTGPVIGIDLGTTNSAVAVLSKGRPLILSSKDGYNTIPSIVALTQQGKLQIGHRAKSQMVLNPTQSIFGAKRLVGRDFESPTVKQLKDRCHFEIVAGADRRAAVKLGEKVLSLEEVQALVLKECREMAEQTLGVPVSRAVITCPAYYSEPQREAVRRAGAMAGLKVERVLNEPTAAALAFGMNRELKKTVLVYDLGGGTFDATLLKVEENVFEVLATGGDVFLGGTDFDNQLVDLLLQRFLEWHKRPFAGDRVALSRVAEAAEKAKIALSERTTFDVSLPMLELDAGGKPLDLRTTLTRADVEAVCAELIERTLQAVQDVLLDAKLKASQVDDVILVGGMSRMPLVREKLKAIFKKPPQAAVNADEAVALGAALYSGTVDKVSSLVLIDVVPMTIGLGRPGGAFHRLIERNTPLPATKSFGLSTQRDDETELEVMVFQGEDSNVAGNEFLGAVTITGLPKGPKGAVQVAVTLGLDAECVLRVEAREFKTRTVVRATLATRYTTEEIAQRLGISAEKRASVNKSRTEELEKRAGGFWGKVKSLFRR
jgi:molecular chaperone DnaK (HSP70)